MLSLYKMRKLLTFLRYSFALQSLVRNLNYKGNNVTKVAKSHLAAV